MLTNSACSNKFHSLPVLLKEAKTTIKNKRKRIEEFLKHAKND